MTQQLCRLLVLCTDLDHLQNLEGMDCQSMLIQLMVSETKPCFWQKNQVQLVNMPSLTWVMVLLMEAAECVTLTLTGALSQWEAASSTSGGMVAVKSIT